MNAQDFESHIQKSGHKEKESELQSTRHLRSIYPLPETSNSVNGKRVQLESLSSVGSVSSVCDGRSTKNDIATGSYANGKDIPLNPAATDVHQQVNLDDLAQAESVSQAIADEIVNITTRTELRIESEFQIVDCLTRNLKAFNSALKMIPFGSATYGFGGSNTNLNILINSSKNVSLRKIKNKSNHVFTISDGSDENPVKILHEFYKFLKTSGSRNEFDDLIRINCTRVQKQRLQMIHKKSGIQCWIECSVNDEITKTSQVIRDCIAFTPLCKCFFFLLENLFILIFIIPKMNV